MKHTHFILMIAAALIFSGCEKTIDDRQRQTDGASAWLLGVQITEIPQDGLFYDCLTRKCNFAPVQLSKKDLPYYFRIDGGMYLRENSTVTICARESINATPDTLVKVNPTVVKFCENGVSGEFIFW